MIRRFRSRFAVSSKRYPVYDDWLPRSLGPNKKAFVRKVLEAIGTDPFQIMCFVVALLEDGRAREAAKEVNAVLLEYVEEMIAQWEEDQSRLSRDEEEEDVEEETPGQRARRNWTERRLRSQ